MPYPEYFIYDLHYNLVKECYCHHELRVFLGKAIQFYKIDKKRLQGLGLGYYVKRHRITLRYAEQELLSDMEILNKKVA